MDEQGRYFDIHALRHEFGTLLSKSGVSPREAMELMRHTDMRLTMNLYTDPRIFDLKSAVEKMPTITPTTPDSQQQAATGTDATIPFPNATRIGNDVGSKRVAQEVARTATYGQCSASNGTHHETKNLQDLSGKSVNRHSNAPIDITADGGSRTRNLWFTKPLLCH